MTTKQDIIDYIDNAFTYDHDDDTFYGTFKQLERLQYIINKLMINPRVKPLLWHKHPDGLDEYVSNIGYFVIEEFNSGFNIFWDGEEMPEANSLEKAQAYCQSCHDMEILGMIEYE